MASEDPGCAGCVNLVLLFAVGVIFMLAMHGLVDWIGKTDHRLDAIEKRIGK
jgi:hypothetical protein